MKRLITSSGSNGAVSSASKLASAEGIKVLKNGGNAVDAALTMASILTLDEPYFNSIGGHGILLIYSSKTNSTECLDFGGFLPKLFNINQLGNPPRLNKYSPTCTVFPALLSGWNEVLRKFGSYNLKSILKPSIDYAFNGIEVTPTLQNNLKNIKDNTINNYEFNKIYFPQNKVPDINEKIYYPDLGNTYELIAKNGIEYFYNGPLTKTICNHLNKVGSRFTLKEFNSYKPIWRDTLICSYPDGFEVVVPKCQTASPTILTQLNILNKLGQTVSEKELIHLKLEIAKIALNLRSLYCGDPKYHDIKYDYLISEELAEFYLNKLNVNITLNDDIKNISSHLTPDGTSHLCVVDSENNIVTLTQTIGPHFGTLDIIPGTGILMNNEGIFFDLLPINGPNYPVGGKLSQHDMSPVLIYKCNNPIVALGTPGGTGITQTTTQVIQKIISNKYDIGESIADDRYRYYGNNNFKIENVNELTKNYLLNIGHKINEPHLNDPNNLFDTNTIWPGGFNAITTDKQNNLFTSASDWRRNCSAMSF
jgi:gamma-glutamyltranspeptidase